MFFFPNPLFPSAEAKASQKKFMLFAASLLALSGCAKKAATQSPPSSVPTPQASQEIHSDCKLPTSPILRNSANRYRYLEILFQRSDRLITDLEDSDTTDSRVIKRIIHLRKSWTDLKAQATKMRYFDPSYALSNTEELRYHELTESLISLSKGVVRSGQQIRINDLHCDELSYSMDPQSLLSSDEPIIAPVKDDY